MEITQQEYERYEECRSSGITNMFMIGNVSAITELSKDKVMYIMKNYEKLSQEFG